MAFRIVRNDITDVRADAIVNTANMLPEIGCGTDSAVYNAAGRDVLLNARRKIGVIHAGEAAYTSSFGLKKNGVKYIIHTVGTLWQGGQSGETDVLRSCYRQVLALGKKLGCKSLGLPLLASGNYGFPREICVKIATEEITNFLIENDMEIVLVVFDRRSFLISEKIFDDIQCFIDDNYSQESDYDAENNVNSHFLRNRISSHIDKPGDDCFKSAVTGSFFHGARAVSGVSDYCEHNNIRNDNSSVELDDFLSREVSNCNFQDKLVRLIADKNLPNAVIYKKAGLSRQFFSKMISIKNYVPKKRTVMALGLVLNLSIEEFEDFMASAGYAFMASEKFDLVVKYCVIHHIYNLMEVDGYLVAHNLPCFADY